MRMKVINIFCVSSILCSQFASHCASVARKHHTLLAHHHRRLQGTLVIISGHTACNLLRFLVAFVVAVVHTLPILVNREAFGFGKAISGLMRSTCSPTLGQHIVSLNYLAIRQSNFIGIAILLFSCVPFITNSRSYGIAAQLGLFSGLACIILHALLLLGHGLLVQSFIFFITSMSFSEQHLVVFCFHALPIVNGLLSIFNTGCVGFFRFLICSYACTHFRFTILHLIKVLLRFGKFVVHKLSSLICIKSTFATKNVVKSTFRSSGKPILGLHGILSLANSVHGHRFILWCFGLRGC